MFRGMRNKLELSKGECEQILSEATSGVLALSGDDGYPYAVPLSFVFDGESIYFHSAVSGHKIDAIKKCDKASFCVVGAEDVHGDDFTTHFKSVIAFGRMSICDEDKRDGIEKLALKYSPTGDCEKRRKYIERAFEKFLVLRLDIEHLSGKQSRHLKNKS